MLKYENHCVGCPAEIGCYGSSCPLVKLPIYYCDTCKDREALYRIEGNDYCEDCAQEYLLNEFNSLSPEEKAYILKLDFNYTH